MIVKLIRVYVKPGHMPDYLAAQAVWNRETRKADGFVSQFCGRDPQQPDIVQLIFFWRSRQDLDRWMAEEHDRIEALARADRFYERYEVTILDEVLE